MNLLWVAAAMCLTGCGVDLAGWLQVNPTASAPAVVQPTDTPAPTQQATRSAPATPSGPQTLVIWVPPAFDPTANTSAAERLRARLAAFELENVGFKVLVRVKAATGPGGMIDSLSAATAAAPSTLPALVALPRTDLETAALKGLIFPLDGLTHAVDNADWYPYARQLALIQGAAFGLPFAGDGMLLLYRPTRLTTPPADWAGIIKASLPLAFPAADSQSLTTLLLYLSAGGQIKDSQGRPILQAEPLAKVLKQYSAGQQTGVFPIWLAQYQTDGQAWQAYREQRTHLVITWSSRYLADLPADTVAVPIPAMGGQPFTLATGWLWAVSEPQPERRAAAVRLAEYLVTSDFLSQWASAAGYIPTRPSALSSWSNQGLRALLSPVALAAQVRPSNDVLLGLGPVLQEATLQVIKQQGDPVQTAQVAVERLAVNPTK